VYAHKRISPGLFVAQDFGHKKRGRTPPFREDKHKTKQKQYEIV
jgi:hypothetical protein